MSRQLVYVPCGVGTRNGYLLSINCLRKDNQLKLHINDRSANSDLQFYLSTINGCVPGRATLPYCTDARALAECLQRTCVHLPVHVTPQANLITFDLLQLGKVQVSVGNTDTVVYNFAAMPMSLIVYASIGKRQIQAIDSSNSLLCNCVLSQLGTAPQTQRVPQPTPQTQPTQPQPTQPQPTQPQPTQPQPTQPTQPQPNRQTTTQPQPTPQQFVVAAAFNQPAPQPRIGSVPINAPLVPRNTPRIAPYTGHSEPNTSIGPQIPAAPNKSVVVPSGTAPVTRAPLVSVGRGRRHQMNNGTNTQRTGQLAPGLRSDVPIQLQVQQQQQPAVHYCKTMPATINQSATSPSSCQQENRPSTRIGVPCNQDTDHCKQLHTCGGCTDKTANVYFTRCGHVYYCNDCAAKALQETKQHKPNPKTPEDLRYVFTCPLCRVPARAPINKDSQRQTPVPVIIVSPFDHNGDCLCVRRCLRCTKSPIQTISNCGHMLMCQSCANAQTQTKHQKYFCSICPGKQTVNVFYPAKNFLLTN